MNRERLFAAFFFVAFLFLFYQLYLFLAPFAGPLMLAAVLVLSLSPLTEALVRRLRGARTIAALLMSLGVFAVVLIPTAFLLSLLISEATSQYDRVQQLLQQGPQGTLANSESWLGATWQSLLDRFPMLASIDLSSTWLDATKRVSGWVAGEAGALAQNAALRLVDAGILLVALFFFFRDGDRIAGLLRDLLPMDPASKDRILKILYDTVTAVVQSTVMIAVLQGLVAGLGYAFIGRLSVAVLLGFLTGVASLVPVVGSALVWVPAALYVMATVDLWRGGALALWGLVAVGSVDSVVRPLVIGGRVQIPTMLLMFALLGGIQVYGFLGIFVAPVVVAILLAFVGIYRERYVGADEGATSA